MDTPPTSLQRRKRETLLLILVAVFGISGLLVLQLTKKDPVARSEDRSMVQSALNNTANAGAPAGEAIQKIPGNLIRENEQPEAGRPFLFEMANFSQGAVYELDLGDGSRKSFQKGVLRHTYAKPGVYNVTLYAKFDGEEVKLQTVQKVVAQTVQVEKKITPVIDF